MVLESLFNADSLEAGPWRVAILGVLFVSAAVIATNYLGASFSADASSILLIALVALPSLSEILQLFQKAEIDEEHSPFLGSKTLGRNYPVLIVLLVYFIALILAFTAWFVFLPAATSTHLFSAQLTELKSVQASVSGKVLQVVTTNGMSASASDKLVKKFEDNFQLVFLHNLEVLLLVLAFSAVYGAGAVLILAWNASVIGVFLGQLAQKAVQLNGPDALFSTIGTGLLGLAPHGVLELLAYSAAALAGGILSAALMHKAYERGGLFILIIRDLTKLLAWSIIFLGLAAAIESGALTF